MFCHPSFIARDIRRNAQSKAFLAEKGIAAIARAIAPNLTRLREMHNVLGVILRPWNVLLPRLQRRSYRVHTWDDPMDILIDLREHRQSDPRHDAHVHNGIGGVGKLHTNPRHRGTNRSHRVGQNIHRPTAHRPAKEVLHLLAHDEWGFPVIGRPGIIFGKGANEGAVFNARHVIRGRSSAIAPRPQRLV